MSNKPPLTPIKREAWLEFQEATKRFTVPNFLSEKSTAQFYRDISARELGTYVNNDETAHERFAEKPLSSRQDFFTEWIDLSKTAYVKRCSEITNSVGGDCDFVLPEYTDIDTPVFILLHKLCGFDHMPNAESWQHAGELFMAQTICTVGLHTEAELKNAGFDTEPVSPLSWDVASSVPG